MVSFYSLALGTHPCLVGQRRGNTQVGKIRGTSRCGRGRDREHPGVVGEELEKILVWWGKRQGTSRCGGGKDRAHPGVVGEEIGHIEVWGGRVRAHPGMVGDTAGNISRYGCSYKQGSILKALPKNRCTYMAILTIIEPQTVLKQALRMEWLSEGSH